ncbi:MAG: ribonuclease [Anaerotignum sp.]|nr:ribonuclease [Anaerotignum sp.]
MKKKLTAYLMTLLMLMLTLFSGCGGAGEEVQGTDEAQTEAYTIDEDGWYYSTEDVALYLYTYGELPDNFITKKEAQKLGWDNKKGNLWEVADGMCIGGDYFGNYEGLLPEEDEYTECDVNYEGGYRGAERIIFSDDGDIYYTGDHYESFEQLY